MSDSELDEFAARLISEVRDTAIASCKGQLKEGALSSMAKKWENAILNKDLSAGERIVADVVDEVIFSLLDAIDNGRFELVYKTNDGKAVSLQELGRGELGGCYMALGGWRNRFSRETVADYFE